MADHEKPEMKTMTYGTAYREHGFMLDETIGLAGAADDLDRAAAGEPQDHTSHSRRGVDP